ncbi:MAG: 3-hydroxy-3-methylglutaryl-CoA reductase, partial [Candidatus Eremiobacteraeota bacterium]|nr:3-hydroxy-3-methylglutaryl-CoA reductase [Candidatus Eremiobacteraeota bacterium]
MKVPGDDSKRLSRKFHPSQPHVTRSGDISEQSVQARLDLVRLTSEERGTLADAQTLAQRERYARNIENFIGTVKVPVGLAGPLRVNGTHAQGDYYIPLATTEAALVASYSRGAQTITEAGGCAAILIDECVSRGPAFAFADVQQAQAFAAWVSTNVSGLRAVAEATTRHGKLRSLETTIEGNHVYL